MKKKTKWLLLTMMLILVFSMTGCGVSAGNEKAPILKDYYDFFDREKPEGVYKNSMMTYEVKTQNHGEMRVVLDTSEGHVFKMDESGDFFTIYDKNGEEVIKTNFYLLENYRKDTANLTDIERINFRDFFVGEYGGGFYAMSYMADCGFDLGIFMQAYDMDSFKLVAFDGEPLEGSSSDIHFYQGEEGEKEPEAEEPEVEEPEAEEPEVEEPEAEEPENEDDTVASGTGSGKYYTIPEGYECTYTGEFFESYMGDDGSVTFDFAPNSEIEDFLSEGDDSYYDMYKLSMVSTLDTAKGKIYIVKAYDSETDSSSYYGMSEDKSISFAFNVFKNGEITAEDCEDFVKKFIR